MADMINRLTELLAEADYLYYERLRDAESDSEVLKTVKSVYGIYADHLIANGVITHEWISVEDRLPKRPGMYLVTGRSYGDKTPKIWICEFIKFGPFAGWCNNALNPCVKAWMPLPDPPKEAEKVLGEKVK